MLELRPVCENCGARLSPDSVEARICSFECTFCRACVEGILEGVCPNCGGGFEPRPVRPQKDWKGGNFLGRYPATSEERIRRVDASAHCALVDAVRNIPPSER